VPEHLDWYIWRPIVHERQLCTLRELEEHYSLSDLADMHDALDVVDALAAKAHAENERRRAEAQRKN